MLTSPQSLGYSLGYSVACSVLYTELYTEIEPGVFVGGLNFDVEPRLAFEYRYPDLHGYESSDEEWLGSYGVVDSIAQWKKVYAAVIACPNRKFAVSFCEIWRDHQPPNGGWRWHKWGKYYGTKNPQHEYLYDEEGIDSVLVFHVLELPAR